VWKFKGTNLKEEQLRIMKITMNYCGPRYVIDSNAFPRIIKIMNYL